MHRVMAMAIGFLLLGDFVSLATPGVAPAPTVTYVCTARSITGRRYSATGINETLTQEAAMQKCQASSWRCYPTGCTTGGARA